MTKINASEEKEANVAISKIDQKIVQERKKKQLATNQELLTWIPLSKR